MPPRRGVRMDPSHFLTFAEYTPDNATGHRAQPSFSPTHRKRTASSGLGLRTREQFMCANYSFCMSPDAAVSTNDPDAPVDWDNVDVVLESSQPSDCPICLHPLRSPRITRCGHIFDHVCALQHLHYASLNPCHTKSARCPICSDRMTAKDLRKVEFRGCKPLTLGAKLSLKLVSRPRSSIIVRESYAAHEPYEHAIPTQLSGDDTLFTKLVFADTKLLLELVERNLRDLDEMLHDEPSLKPFVEAARTKTLDEHRLLLLRLRHETAANPPSGELSPPSDCQFIPQPFSKFSPGSLSDFPTSSVGHGSSSGVHVDKPLTSSGKDLTDNNCGTHIFYQAQDGQAIYLHPICHRILSAKFSDDYLGAPSSIEGRVLEIERHTMDDVLRRRYRFLGHLPLGCEFLFVEIDLSSVVPEETLASFHEEISQREVTRRRRALASEREDRRIEEFNSQSLRKYFQLSEGRLSHSVPVALDRSDVSSFPPILVPDEETCVSSSSDSPSSLSSATPVGQSHSKPRPYGNLSTDVSSYSAATRHMGVFPELSSTVPAPTSGRETVSEARSQSSITSSRSHPIAIPRSPCGSHPVDSFGDSAWSKSPARTSSVGSSPRNSNSDPLQYTQAESSIVQPSAVESSSPSQGTTRRGRRHNGRNTITLLSNAGPNLPYRR